LAVELRGRGHQVVLGAPPGLTDERIEEIASRGRRDSE
jgi:hypothetical protein